MLDPELIAHVQLVIGPDNNACTELSVHVPLFFTIIIAMTTYHIKQGNNSKYFHPKSWKDSSLLERLRILEPSLEIQLDSCICRLCRDNMKGIRFCT